MFPTFLFTSKLLQDILKKEDETLPGFCEDCNSEESVNINYQYEYKIPHSDRVVVAPSWVCDHCGKAYFKDEGLEAIMQAFKEINGKPWEKVSVKCGKLSTMVLH